MSAPVCFRATVQLTLLPGTTREQAEALLEQAFTDVFEGLWLAPEHVVGWDGVEPQVEGEDALGFGHATVSDLEQVSS